MLEEQEKFNKKLLDGKKEAEGMKDTLKKMFNMFDEFKNEHNWNERIDIINNIQCPNCNRKEFDPDGADRSRMSDLRRPSWRPPRRNI